MPVNGVGDMPNQHDMLTGSDSTGPFDRRHDGHDLQQLDEQLRDGQRHARHHDRLGGQNTSWNSAHASRGCSQANLVSTGGAGCSTASRAN
jgi:hypothetical protein